MEPILKQFRFAFLKKEINNAVGFDVYFSNKQSSIIDNLKEHIVFINYDYKNKIENFQTKNTNPLCFPETLFIEVEKKITTNKLSNSNSKKDSIKINLISTVSKEEYITKFNSIKNHIHKGDVYEMNYCITFEAKDVKINPIELFEKLNSISDAPFACLAKFDHQYIISSSPELYISKRENTLFTKPIKGTAKRGKTSSEDDDLKNNLLHSLKERTENVMIVDVCRNDLSRIAKKGTVTVEKLFDIESYKQVHQMVSTVKCQLKENTTFKEIIVNTFPMASMTGAPKIRAMQLIDEYELYNRGPYSGAIGYIDKNGDFDLSVLIRSIFYDEKKHYLSFSVGSAITAMCNAEDEYEECLLKAKAMIQVLST
jgi:para-aminobenzoate synthetase component 1